MKAREQKLGLPHFDADTVNIRQWIYSNCASYQEAADFFCISKRTVERWMSGQINPSPIAARAIALYEQSRKVA
jgi:DNA-binding transcriptional regulator YiaG